MNKLKENLRYFMYKKQKEREAEEPIEKKKGFLNSKKERSRTKVFLDR